MSGLGNITVLTHIMPPYCRTPPQAPALATGSPPPGGLCSQKTAVLVRWRMRIEAIRA